MTRNRPPQWRSDADEKPTQKYAPGILGHGGRCEHTINISLVEAVRTPRRVAARQILHWRPHLLCCSSGVMRLLTKVQNVHVAGYQNFSFKNTCVSRTLEVAIPNKCTVSCAPQNYVNVSLIAGRAIPLKQARGSCNPCLENRCLESAVRLVRRFFEQLCKENILGSLPNRPKWIRFLFISQELGD